MYQNHFGKATRFAFTALGLLAVGYSHAQISLTGQLRTRTEVRNGLGNLQTKGAQSAVFTSQRTRINFGYKWDRLTFGAALQDVRVWGQDASSITNNDGARLMLHEGWADLTLANKADTTIAFKWIDQLSLKVGRQELVYDDARLIGNLDWLQQARRHDMALLKAMHHGWQIEAGYAFNQNTDAFGVASTAYAPGNVPAYVKNSIGVLVPVAAGFVPLVNAAGNSTSNGNPSYTNPPSTNGANQDYKSFTTAYISRKFNQTKVALLFFNDNFGKSHLDSISVGGGMLYGKRYAAANAADTRNYSGYNSRFTYGGMITHTIGNASGFGKIALQGAFYKQTGSDRDGKNLNAFHLNLQATYQKGKFSITPGIDILSGNDSSLTNTSANTNRFDPLYGTPHKFWGYMDYFYVGTGSPTGGLADPYFKIKYTSNMLTIGADYHYFTTHKAMKGTDGKFLGSEIDLQLNYNMNKFTNIELGYSLMFASKNMPIAKAQVTTLTAAENYNRTGTWFYAMLKFTPDFFYAKPVAIKQ